MNEPKFNETVEALFKGMDSFITTKTVVGDAVHVEDGTILLPLVDVSFGVGAGAFQNTSKNSASGGMGGKITPNSVLVIHEGKAKLVSVKNQDVISKAIDLVPEIIDKFKKTAKDKKVEADMEKAGQDYIDGLKKDE